MVLPLRSLLKRTMPSSDCHVLWLAQESLADSKCEGWPWFALRTGSNGFVASCCPSGSLQGALCLLQGLYSDTWCDCTQGSCQACLGIICCDYGIGLKQSHGQQVVTTIDVTLSDWNGSSQRTVFADYWESGMLLVVGMFLPPFGR
jgi:hypothetical protein